MKLSQAKLQNPNPECVQENCRFVQDVQFTSTLAYTPIIYDKQGMIIPVEDPNETNGKVNCLTCQKVWNFKSKYGIRKYKLDT